MIILFYTADMQSNKYEKRQIKNTVYSKNGKEKGKAKTVNKQ